MPGVQGQGDCSEGEGMKGARLKGVTLIFAGLGKRDRQALLDCLDLAIESDVQELGQGHSGNSKTMLRRRVSRYRKLEAMLLASQEKHRAWKARCLAKVEERLHG